MVESRFAECAGRLFHCSFPSWSRPWSGFLRKAPYRSMAWCASLTSIESWCRNIVFAAHANLVPHGLLLEALRALGQARHDYPSLLRPAFSGYPGKAFANTSLNSGWNDPAEKCLYLKIIISRIRRSLRSKNPGVGGPDSGRVEADAEMRKIQCRKQYTPIRHTII
jgi:hypothetical protein